jgi:DNA-directed RNA polymerase subunit RPC12/RpoP
MMASRGEQLIRIKERSGKWKYRCADCGTENYLSAIEWGWAARPRCTGCGSHRLDRIEPTRKKGRA